MILIWSVPEVQLVIGLELGKEIPYVSSGTQKDADDLNTYLNKNFYSEERISSININSALDLQVYKLE